ncbi:VC_2705 family sodium/solute symporter [Mesorhizobium sp. 1B3]|uniref:VC_2705 family sodium/solute symporter n=1 Tax=Mesorhizobium sp. 1B3 TaxID=3243599 RepID=UPI003D988ACD
MARTANANGPSPRPGFFNALFGLGFVAFMALMAILSSIGVPHSVIGPIVIGAMMMTFGAIGFTSGTMQVDEFYLAGRRTSPAYNGMVAGANFLSTVSFIGLTGLLYLLGHDGLAFVLGCAGGFVLAGTLIAPYLPRTGAYSIPDFLAARYGSNLVRLIGVVVLFVSCFIFGTAQIYGAAIISAHMLGIAFQPAIYLALACLLAASVLGGMRSVIRVQAAQYVVLVIAYLVPVIWMSVVSTGVPFPQLTYGQALQEIRALEAAQAISPGYLTPFSHHGFRAGDYLLLSLCLMAGTASLPHVLARYLATPSARAARISVAWSLFFVLAFLLAVPAYAAFARWAMLDLIGSGLTPDNIAQKAGWLLRRAATEGASVTVCGKPAVDAAAIAAACAERGVSEIRLTDIGLAPETITLAAPEMFGMPYVVSVLVAAGAIAAALASAQGLLLACSNAVSHDLYFRMLDRHAPTARRLAMSRVLLVLIIGCAAYAAAIKPADMLSVVLWPFSLAAAGLFPALVLGIWWRPANATGAAAGMIAGFGLCLYYMLGTRYGAVDFYQTWSALSSATPAEAARFANLVAAWKAASGEARETAWAALDAHARIIANWWGVSGVSAAAFGLPLGLLVTIAVSGLTRRRSDKHAPTTAEPISDGTPG